MTLEVDNIFKSNGEELFVTKEQEGIVMFQGGVTQDCDSGAFAISLSAFTENNKTLGYKTVYRIQNCSGATDTFAYQIRNVTKDTTLGSYTVSLPNSSTITGTKFWNTEQIEQDDEIQLVVTDGIIGTGINGQVPVGTVVAFLKGFAPTLPSGWVECNGQTLSDPDSIYDGLVIPNLNGLHLFLRGNSTYGTTGGAATHTHDFDGDTDSDTHSHSFSGTTGYEDSTIYTEAGTATSVTDNLHRHSFSGNTNSDTHDHDFDGTTDSASSLPPYVNIVWIMKVKRETLLGQVSFKAETIQRRDFIDGEN